MNDFETIPEIADGFLSREISPREVVCRSIERIKRLDPHLNAFLEVADVHAKAAATNAEDEIFRNGPRGPLHGIPFALKDIIDRQGFRTTAYSRLLDQNIARSSAASVRRLEAAGAIFIGKVATHEFALGGPAFDLPAPPARNPWDTDHFTGGSSSGSGAAVAGRLVPFALGTDTGGSVRNPAAACGIVGMKPTCGTVDLDGVIPLSQTLDAIGPLTCDVQGNSIVLDVLAGTSSAERLEDVAHKSLAEVRVGVIRRYYCEDLEACPETGAAIEAAIGVLSSLGAVVLETNAPPLSELSDCNRIILISEAYANHRKSLRERYYDYSGVTRARILPGAYVTAADYAAACALRYRYIERVDSVLCNFDVLITATNMDPPARLDSPLELNTQYGRHARAPFSLTGHPAISIPIGFTSKGLPLAMQISGGYHRESDVYRVARAYEMAVPEAFGVPALAK